MKNFENIAQINELGGIPEKKETEFQIGDNNIKEVTEMRTVRRVTQVGKKKSRRVTRNTKRGSFMRIHSKKSIVNSKKGRDSHFASIMDKMIQKQVARDSDSEEEAPPVSLTRFSATLPKKTRHTSTKTRTPRYK